MHDSKAQKEYDRLRDEAIGLRNLKIIRFRNDDVFNRKDEVIETIIDLTPRPPLLNERGRL